MSFMVGRDGNISLFRVGTLVAILGVILIVGGIAAYWLDQNSYRTPIEVAPYPSAESWGRVQQAGTTRRFVYRVPDAAPEDVVSYYEQELREFGGSNVDGCVRNPAFGEVRGATDDPSVVPYSFRCLFQRTGLGASQQTTITIQPGVYNNDPELNTQGMTVVEHSERWQP